MTLPWGHNGLANSLHAKIWDDIIEGVVQWAGFVEQADVQGDLHFLDQSEIEKLGLWIRAVSLFVFEPVARVVSLETLCLCALSVSCN